MRTPTKKTRSSGEKKFAAFDFTEDDERVEKTSRKLLSRLNNLKKPKKSEFSSPVDKYKFLQFFARGTKNEQNNNRNTVDIDDSDDKTEERFICLDASESSGKQTCVSRAGRFEGRVGDNNDPKCYPPRVLADIKPVSLDSDDDQSIEIGLSTSALGVATWGGVSEDDLLEVNSNSRDVEKMVVINPNYIIYGDMWSMEAQLTFSLEGIKLEGLTLFGTKRSFSYVRATSEIVSIESVWCESVKLAEMSLCFKSEDMKLADIANNSSGIMRLAFAVSDSQWSQREDEIKSLHLRYKATWNSVLDIDTVKSEEASLCQNFILFSQHYCPDDSAIVVYPKGDPDAVSISKRDIELLQPETFINDTIIDFYIKYLQNRIGLLERHRFHFFNSFFFRKLADLDRDSSRVHEGRVAFQRVHKWTKKVNLFEKHFIFIPVNFSLHWSLIVICHPGEVVNFRDEELEKSSKVPCILHMDSIRGSHRGIRNLFQSYLWEEWKNRHDEATKDVSERFMNLPFISLELPQQTNSFDCGLFLLHYLELFLEKVLVELNSFNLAQSSSFLHRKWFPPAEASEKRLHIRKLIEIIKDNPHEDSIATSDDKYLSQDVNEGGICIDLHEEICVCREGYSCGNYMFDPVQEVQITSRVATPLKVLPCSEKSSFVFGDILKREQSEKSTCNGNPQQEAEAVTDKFDIILSPIEEEKELGEQSSLLQTKKGQAEQPVEICKPLSSPHQPGSSRTMPEKRFSGTPVNLEELDPMESSPGISAIRPSISVEPQNSGDCVPVILIPPSPEKANYVSESSSMSSGELAACIIEDSEEEDGSNSLNDNANPSFCHARAFALSLEEVDSTDSTNCNTTQMQKLSGLERKPAVQIPRGSVREKCPTRDLFEDLD